MKKDLKNMLKDGASALGITLGDSSVEMFFTYLEELKVWNRKINLTSIDSDEEAVTRHFLDSLTLYRFIKGSKTLLDIGAGAGFPGIPLKIAEPELEVVLIDSVEKKIHFIRHIIRVLGLKGVSAVSARVEDPDTVGRYGNSFDIVASRAFTELKNLIPLCLPYARPGGMIAALKGPAAKEEIKEVFGELAASLNEVRVPFTDRVNTVVLVKKPL